MRRFVRIILCVWLMTVRSAAMDMPPTVTREQAEAALRAAFSVLGTPYVWGGQDPSGFDCSGLAIWAYNHAVPGIHWYTGDSLVDDTTAHMLFVYNVKPLRPREVWPGDLVFVTGSTTRVTHMGLFSRWLDGRRTEFEWIEASSVRKAVVVSTWTRGEEDRERMLVAVGRVLLWPFEEEEGE
jgi:hypothetical protein